MDFKIALSVSEKPEVEFHHWQAFRIIGRYHLIDEQVKKADGSPRVSSPITLIDPAAMVVGTSSGREYRLIQRAKEPWNEMKESFFRDYCSYHRLDTNDIAEIDAAEVARALAPTSNHWVV